MESERNIQRLKKRIVARFGQEMTDKVAFTEDVSRTGIFIKTTNVIQPGRVVKVVLSLDQGEVDLEGIVIWAKKVPPNLIRLMKKCGMGIRITRFLQGEEEYLRLFSEGAL